MSALAVGLVVTSSAGCQQPDRLDDASSSPQRVIYGEDDRVDVYAFQNQVWANRVADFTVALMESSTIDDRDPEAIRFRSTPLGTDRRLCEGERFADQETAAFCSGTLIAPDLVLTAGHCIASSDCASTRLVFGYYMTDASTRNTVISEDVFACEEIVARSNTSTLDYAIVKLDREATGRTPARVADSPTALAPATPLIVNGFPSGLPIKIDDGGAVRDGRGGPLDYFVANLDTFGGNSGSGVFARETETLVGILVRGETDYVSDGTCTRANRCDDDGCRGEDSTYAFRALEALCATEDAPDSLCTCGDGTCDAGIGETTATCARDCGSACGDGACNGDESPITCADDCGSCGNLVCDAGETPATCCTDCGCEGDNECRDNFCIPSPGAGDTCEAPISIEPVGGVHRGSSELATPTFSNSCGGSSARDRVYTFTVDEPAILDARVTGFDTVLALRSDCADPGSELACNDDSTPPGGLGSRIEVQLDPGTYFLIIDAFGSGTSANDYELTVDFREVPRTPGDTCESAIEISANSSQTVRASTADGRDDLAGSCGGDGAGELVYSFEVMAPGRLRAAVGGFDTVLYLRSDCANPGSEIACNDDRDDTTSTSLIEADLDPGTYFLVVDGRADRTGAFELDVEILCAEDSDNDGTPDCIDVCPNDDTATDVPPPCGCGVEPTDADNDGTPDCIDVCPNDDTATDVPPPCGCGEDVADTDADGTPDCNDMCGTDPGKTEPGKCGCGVADVDSDNDGMPDCIDVCPNDDSPATDSDGDGTPDCVDMCSADPDKTEPGACGCLVPDTDTDADGIPDCSDECLNDARNDCRSGGCRASNGDLPPGQAAVMCLAFGLLLLRRRRRA